MESEVSAACHVLDTRNTRAKRASTVCASPESVKYHTLTRRYVLNDIERCREQTTYRAQGTAEGADTSMHRIDQ